MFYISLASIIYVKLRHIYSPTRCFYHAYFVLHLLCAVYGYVCKHVIARCFNFLFQLLLIIIVLVRA